MDIQPIHAPGTVLPAAGKAAKTTEGKFVQLLAEIEKGEQMLDRTIRSAMKGRDFSAQELIALQAGVYQYTQRLEIFSKLVDRVTSAVRQVLNP